MTKSDFKFDIGCLLGGIVGAAFLLGLLGLLWTSVYVAGSAWFCAMGG